VASAPRIVGRATDASRLAGYSQAIFRLGPELVVRLPLTPRWHDIDSEACWLRALRTRLPVRIPEAVAIGEADETYPWKWGVLRWLEGSPWRLDDLAVPLAAVDQLAEMITVLRALDTTSLPCGKPVRRPPLQALDEQVRAAVDGARYLIDEDAFLAAWDKAVATPEFEGKPLLSHGDRLAGNVLVHKGRLHAVIDWAGICRADPARELMAAWTLFAGESRAAFRRNLQADELT
jgi:aminoglycoside phosphotransferase (APT) family kinase protein